MKYLIHLSLVLLLQLSAFATDIDLKPFYLPNTDIDVLSYSTKLDIIKMSPTAPIKAELIISLNALEPKSSIKLHAAKKSIKLLLVKVNNEEVQAGFLNDYTLEVKARTAKNLNYVVHLFYEITPYQLGLKRGLFFNNNVLSVENWPYYTRNWIPSNDAPQDVAQFEILVNAPEDMNVISNGELIFKKNNSFAWKMKEKMPTYGVNLVVGKYRSKKKDLCFKTTTVNNNTDLCKEENVRKIPLYLYLKSNISEDDFEVQFKAVAESARSVAFFSSFLGIYQFEKVGFISAIQSFNMEYPTLITGLGANVHEIAHHWFGNTVYIKHWGDLWISEGFTTYLTSLYDEIFLNVPIKLKATREIVFNHTEETNPYSIFNDGPYTGGASSLHALRNKLRTACGFSQKSQDDYKLIFALIRAVYQEYKGKSLSTKELVQFFKNRTQATLSQNVSCGLSQTQIESIINSWKADWYNL